MNIDFIEGLRKKYLMLGECSEEDIKIKIVIPFLMYLGYKEDNFKYEYPVIKNKKITDITILGSNGIQLIVEVKKNNLKELRVDSLHQLLSYLIIKNTEWGILTNGKEFLLVNSRINAEYKDKEVISFNLLDYFQENNLYYFGYDALFISRESYYKKYLQQFKVYKLREKSNKTSLYNFAHTIEKYFMFCSKKYGEFRGIDYLNEQDFKQFIMFEIEESKKHKKQISSKATIINKYRHINSFYELFLKNKETGKNPFRHIKPEQMFEGLNIKYKDSLEDIDLQLINTIFEHFDSNTYEPERNKLILLLCIYAGLNRDDIRLLKVDDFSNNSLNINGLSIPLPKNFYTRIMNYINNIRDKEAKVDYLFCSNYSDYAGQPLVQGRINSIIKSAVTAIEEKNGVPININPENIRKVLIRKFFEIGFSIEEIITILDLDIDRVGYYISTDEIKERTNISRISKEHPYIGLF